MIPGSYLLLTDGVEDCPDTKPPAYHIDQAIRDEENDQDDDEEEKDEYPWSEELDEEE